MYRTLLIATLLLALAGPAVADYDPKLEAQEAAQRKAEAAAAAKRKAEADKLRSAAEMKVMRGQLGKEAEGKSDAEVKGMYGAMRKSQTDMAKKAASGYVAPGSDMAKGDAQMKAMTGKSMQDIQKMTPAEQEAFARQMEKQYGGAK